MRFDSTIAAISTARAPGGIGIIRISGEKAFEIAGKVFKAKSGKPLSSMKGYTAALGGVYSKDGEKLDDAVALVFRAPASYTGEDVAELSCHGGLYITERILQEIIDSGAAPAGPGEFTKRAFLNGKMDLIEAESVMSIISASGEQAARAAAALGDGALSKRLGGVKEKLYEQASHLSAWADFPEEDVPEVDEAELLSALREGEAELSLLLSEFDKGRMFREGISTAIVGGPNAGKSTLMNLLSGRERSIVTEIAGTTRDVVEDTVVLSGIPLLLADTAGIRDTQDPVEKIGVSSARKRIETAELILAVFDSSRELTAEDEKLIEELPEKRTVAVINKTDLEKKLCEDRIKERFSNTVYISAASGQGLSELKETVSGILGTGNFDPLSGVLSTQRQRDEAKRAREALSEGIAALSSGMTLDAVTVCVEDAISALCEMTGENASEQIIDRVFDTFCVGK